MAEFQKVLGMVDILPEAHDYANFIKKVIRYHGRRNGFKRVSVPIIEYFSLFQKAYGENSPFLDRLFYFENEGKQMVLRPENRIGIARAYIENNLKELPQPIQYYYVDPSFIKVDPREERQYAQCYQFGFEVLGEEDPALDVQIIQMCKKIFDDFGLQDFFIKINNIGNEKDRKQYNEDLRNFYAGKERSLCDSCIRNLENNPMVLLNCKEEDCKILLEIAPSIKNVLSPDSIQHYDKIKSFLNELGIKYEENEKFVTDRKYYTKTIFEFYTTINGKTISLGKGGRYDGLVQELGGEPTPAVGFSANMNVLIEMMNDIHIQVPSKDKAHVFVVQLGDDAKRVALKLVSDLRDNGIKTVGALGKGSISSQLETAKKFAVDYALVIGQMEVVEKKIIIRDLKKGTQEVVPFDGIIDKMIEIIGVENLDAKNFQAMLAKKDIQAMMGEES